MKKQFKTYLKYFYKMNNIESESIFYSISTIIILLPILLLGLSINNNPTIIISIIGLFMSINIIIHTIKLYIRRREDTLMYYEEGKRKGMINFQYTINKYKDNK